MYDRAFRRWKEFALSKHELSYLPANPMHVAVYLQYVLESTRSSSSVDTAFYSIKWAHESAGLVSPTDNPLVNRVREAAKRILGAKRCHRKEPLSIEIIKDIISAADLSNTLQLRNICLYVLCYAGFLDRRRSPVLDEIILRFMMAIWQLRSKRVKLISLGRAMRLLSHNQVVVLVQFPFFETI